MRAAGGRVSLKSHVFGHGFFMAQPVDSGICHKFMTIVIFFRNIPRLFVTFFPYALKSQLFLKASFGMAIAFKKASNPGLLSGT